MGEATKEYYSRRIAALESDLDRVGKELVLTVDSLEEKIKHLEATAKEQRLRISDLEMGIDNFRGKAMLDK